MEQRGIPAFGKFLRLPGFRYASTQPTVLNYGGLAMGILQWSLGNQGRFVGIVTAGWTTISAIALLGRKILTEEFGSPEFVGIMLLTPIIAVVWSIVMWKLFFKSNPYRKAKRE